MRASLVVDDPVVASALRQLARAAGLGHSGRSFLEHMLGTWRVLADWRMPLAVCRAGFLHSAYSTSFYPHALFELDQRATVRALIGREAEALAYRFCTMDRRGFWDALARGDHQDVLTYPDRLHSGLPVRVARKTLVRLLIMESANTAEQSRAEDGGPAPWMSRVFRWWTFLDDRSIPLRADIRPRLTRRSDDAAIAAYRLALTAPARRAIPLLEEAMRQNPWAAEPKVVRGLCAVEVRDPAAAAYIQRGTKVLSAWAVPWDKRLTLNGWKALADRIESSVTQGNSPRFDFESICAVLNKQARKPRWLLG